MKLLVLNGPNLNLLGIRELNIYGKDTYTDLEKYIKEVCAEEEIEVEIFQTNHEGLLVDKIHAALDQHNAILINPAAYTHTSIALLDALKAVTIPTVEVHLSDTDAREDFRKISYISQACIATIKGQGFAGYKQGIKILKEYLNKEQRGAK